ncbi:MAG: hypothetical protein ABIR55_04155, partial [Burkholderiaceae bacterium]
MQIRTSTELASNDVAAEHRRENNPGMIATAAPANLSMTIRTVLCMSTLQIDATAVGKLFRETRAAGESTGTHGAIVSDGDRVAHMLHGVPEQISVMLNQILSDERLGN